MKGSKKSLSINILSVMIILISLFACSFYGVNSWFSQTHNDGVEIFVDLADLMINVYQKEGGTNRLLTPMLEPEDASYVNLSGKIIPDQSVGLEMVLGNDEAGSSPVFVRFKFTLYVRGVDQDQEISTQIGGYPQQTASSEGFKYNEEDGYYYYSDKQGNPTKLSSGLTVNMMTSFVVDYDDVMNSGQLLNLNGDLVYVVLTVDANIAGWEQE